MTEAGSQVATAELSTLETPAKSSPSLRLLEHFSARVDEEGTLSLRGSSLLSFYVWNEHGEIRISDPKSDGWFQTEDYGRLNLPFWTPDGRLKERIKIGGELTHIGRLSVILEEVRSETDPGLKVTLLLVAAQHDRLGTVIHLAHDARERKQKSRVVAIAARFSERVLPFEKIRCLRFVERFERTALGKIKPPVALLASHEI